MNRKTLSRFVVLLALSASFLTISFFFIGLLLYLAFPFAKDTLCGVWAAPGWENLLLAAGGMSFLFITSIFAIGLLIAGGQFLYREFRHFSRSSVKASQWLLVLVLFFGARHLDPFFFGDANRTHLDPLAVLKPFGYLFFLFIAFHISGQLIGFLTLDENKAEAAASATKKASAFGPRMVRFYLKIFLTLPAIGSFLLAWHFCYHIFPEITSSFFHLFDFPYYPPEPGSPGEKLAANPHQLYLCVLWITIPIAFGCCILTILALRAWKKFNLSSLRFFSLIPPAIAVVAGLCNIDLIVPGLRPHYMPVALVAFLLIGLSIYLWLMRELAFCLPENNPAPVAPAPRPDSTVKTATPSPEITAIQTVHWKCGAFRALLAGFHLLALGVFLFYLLRWEVYYCERYQRPWNFFSDPVWRLPLLILLLEFLTVYFLAGFWKALRHPLIDGVLRSFTYSLSILLFLPLLYTLERPLLFRLPINALPRFSVLTDFLFVILAAGVSLLAGRVCLPFLRQAREYAGFLPNGFPSPATCCGSAPLPPRARYSRFWLFLLALVIALLLLATFHHPAQDYLSRSFFYPKR